MRVYYPPEYCTSVFPRSVFLAGSIELGKAEDWQARAVSMLEDTKLNVFNPRRPSWDWSTEQSINNEQFYEQVVWEQYHLQKADSIIFYFQDDAKSPITLLEFGQMSILKPKSCIVVCPDAFWRKGNVDIVCEINNIKQVDSLEEAVKLLR